MSRRLLLFMTVAGLSLVAACDSTQPEVPSTPEGLLVVTAETAAGEPFPGLALFATYGALLPDDDAARARATAAGLQVFAPFPSPTRTLSLIRFQVSEAGPVRVVLLDVAGSERQVVVDGDLSAGLHQVPIDLSEELAGVYRVAVEADGARAEAYVLKTDAIAEGAQLGLAVLLGTTDAEGRVVVTDSTRFPALYDIPRAFPAIDEQGSVLGEFAVDRAIGLVLQDAGGRAGGQTVALLDGGTVVALTVSP